MNIFLFYAEPYLLAIMTVCLLMWVAKCMYPEKYEAVSGFVNNNSPWTAAMMGQFLSVPSAANHRDGFSALALRLSDSLHGRDNFAPLASKLTGAMRGSGFVGENITEKIKASGAAAQLAAMFNK
jgi:hypothetical protein